MKVLIEIGMKVAKLIDVKSIVTIMLTVTFIKLAFDKHITTEFLSIYTMTMGFYFGYQTEKKEVEIEEK